MWKEAPQTRKKEVLSSHLVQSSRPSPTTVSPEVPRRYEGLIWKWLSEQKHFIKQ